MTLQDHHGRRFTYLRLSITDACNFRCTYCLPDGYQCSDNTPNLSVDEIRRTAMTFAQLGTKKIRITGGEPALRRDLPEIIHAVANVPGIEEVALTTNGWKLPKLLPAWAEAGLTRLNVSIDSLDPRQFQAITGHNRLQELLGGLEVARQLGFTGIKVNAVLMREHNANQLPRFLEWIRETPVTLRFIELMQTGDNHEFFRQNHVRGEDIKTQLLADNWQPVVKHTTDGPAQEFWHPEYAGRIGLIMPYSKDFCQSCNRLRVSATGQLHLCLFGEQGFDLRPFLASDHTLNDAAEFVRRCLNDKKATHALDEGNTGVRTHFAGIGG